MASGKVRSIFSLSLVVAAALIFLLSDMALGQQDRRITRKGERRVALVIGNGAYKSSPLRNPLNDAADMATTLKKLGFRVVHKHNATHRTMEDAIRDFGKQLRKGGVGLFYFAGHGIQVKGRNYLIPVDARIESESDVKFEAVDAGRVLGKMEDAGNSLNIVILDACRDNPFARSFRTTGQGLAKMDAPTGTLIAYATAPGKVAADGDGRNGVYTKHLMKYITIPDLKVESALKRVRIAVIEETGKKQVPWESSSLTGEFYFVSKKSTSLAVRPSAKPPDSTALAEERARLEAERKHLAEEKRRLEAERRVAVERDRLAKEKAKLEAERKRIAEERRRLEKKERKLAAIRTENTDYKQPDIEGKWFWKQDPWKGFFILRKSGNKYLGTLDDVYEGTYGDKIIDVSISKNYIRFTRDGKYGIQYWEGTLEIENGKLKIKNGRWRKKSGSSGHFYAEKKD